MKSLAEGFFMNIAQRTANNIYRTIVDINHDAARYNIYYIYIYILDWQNYIHLVHSPI